MANLVKAVLGWRPKGDAAVTAAMLAAIVSGTVLVILLLELFGPDVETVEPMFIAYAALVAIGGLVGALVFPEGVRKWSFVLASSETAAIFGAAPVRVSEIEFYSLAAQIAPVLLLAVAFETRGYQQRRLENADRISLFVVILSVLVAGGESLRVLALGEASLGWASPVMAGLGGAAFQVSMLAIMGPKVEDQS